MQEATVKYEIGAAISCHAKFDNSLRELLLDPSKADPIFKGWQRNILTVPIMWKFARLGLYLKALPSTAYLEGTCWKSDQSWYEILVQMRLRLWTREQTLMERHTMYTTMIVSFPISKLRPNLSSSLLSQLVNCFTLCSIFKSCPWKHATPRYDCCLWKYWNDSPHSSCRGQANGWVDWGWQNFWIL